MSFTLQTLTEGIRDRHVGQQNKRLVEKWSRTGLLRGMDDTNRENMATLLENQAAQLLRESNTLASGDVRGFTNIAFPIVRRVFGGLVANELVSIQPMSLPSGLLFYLDYTYGSDNGPHKAGESIYGDPKGKLVQDGASATGGQYDLAGAGFSRVHVDSSLDTDADLQFIAQFDPALEAHQKMVQFDDVALGLAKNTFTLIAVKTSALNSADLSMVKDIILTECKEGAAGTASLTQLVGTTLDSSNRAHNVRRLNQRGNWDGTTFTANGVSGSHILMLVRDADANRIERDSAAQSDVAGTPTLRSATDTDGDGVPDRVAGLTVSHVKADLLDAASPETVVTPAFESNMPLDGSAPAPVIPEIDIKIESIPVTAQTRKLRARWSPELAQDLNAYHSMDAEVELTQILSEQIALEIDREILSDLLTGAQGANFFWSRSPGKFVNKRTGTAVERASSLQPGPAFTGTVREWYETLTETIIDVANEIHRKTLRGSANFIVVGPDVATILEASVLYRPSYSLDGDGQVGAPFTMGAEKVGTLSNRFTVYKDPYFPRNKVLVGYKGGSYLETGFVYAPYVPLIVTPTIFQPDDFTPRKGVMTRYGKKMVRADFFGTVTCLDMNVI